MFLASKALPQQAPWIHYCLERNELLLHLSIRKVISFRRRDLIDKCLNFEYLSIRLITTKVDIPHRYIIYIHPYYQKSLQLIVLKTN
jgi:hypothetical protein